MASFFNRPYRDSLSGRHKLLSILSFGLFIFLFLFLFKPFGMYQLEPFRQLFICLGFGMITAVVLIVYKYLIEPVVIKKHWTVGRNILWDIMIASSIGAANYVYILIIFKMSFNLLYLLYSVWTAILVGSIPVTLSYFLAYNRMYRSALKEADMSPEEVIWEEEVIITAGNSKNEFRVNPKKIIYLCSNDNYVTIVTIKDNVQNKNTIRGTLKSAEYELRKNNRFIRCHKCYLINLDFVEKISGRQQNMKIRLLPSGIEIPVARSKSNEVLKRTAKF